MTGAKQLKAALAKKNGEKPRYERGRHPLPEKIIFATPGTHVARDGKPYTITYEETQ